MSSETESQQVESRLLSLPPELFLMIANQLDARDRASLFACSSSLAQTYVPIQATYIDKSGENLLQGAIEMGFYTLARALLTHGADPNLADPLYKHTSLHRVVDRQDVVAVRLLLEFGADTNLAAKHQRFPLHFAVERDSAQMVELLVDAGALLDVGIYSPLELASESGHIDAVRMLLRKGADPDVAPLSLPLWTPLLAAAEQGHAEIAVALIEAGASRNLVEAMHLSGHLGQTSVVKAMVETGKEEVLMTARLLLVEAMDAEESQELAETVQVLRDAGIVVDKMALRLEFAPGGRFRKHIEMLRRHDLSLQ